MIKPTKAQVQTHQKVLSNKHEHDHDHDHDHDYDHEHSHDHHSHYGHDHGHAHGHDHDHDHHDHGHAHHAEDTLVNKSVRFQEYELLEKRNKRKETDNPEAKEYFRARELFTKGFEIASKVPDESEDKILKAHEHEILESTKYLVEAFLIDDNATEMSPRIMSLAQQYEKLIKLTYDGTENEKNAVELEINDAKLGEVIKAKKVNSAQDDPDHLTRESLILVIWLLFNGKQYQFCIQTLTIALNQLEPKLHPRLHHLRALCYLANEDFKNCIKDLERLLSIDLNFVDAYCIQGFVYMSRGDRLDRLEAARNFKAYIEKASKDSVSYSHALYALATLTCQNATSLTTGNRNQVSQNLRYQQAYNYYQKAKEAEKRYEYLYGHTPEKIDAKRIAFIPEIVDVKRNAMAIFEHKSYKETTKVEKDSKKEAEKLAILKQFLTSLPNGEQQKKCNSCGSHTRKDLNGELDAEQKSKLLICARCSNVNYCSKECQKKDWKNGHKQTCATAKTR